MNESIHAELEANVKFLNLYSVFYLAKLNNIFEFHITNTRLFALANLV